MAAKARVNQRKELRPEPALKSDPPFGVNIPQSGSGAAHIQSHIDIDGGDKSLDARLVWLCSSDTPASLLQRKTIKLISSSYQILSSRGDISTTQQSFPCFTIPVTASHSSPSNEKHPLNFEDIDLYSTQALNTIENVDS